MEENNIKEIKKTVGQKIKDNKTTIIVGATCLAIGVAVGVFGPKVIKAIAGIGAKAVVDATPIVEAGLETAAEVAPVVAAAA